MISPETSDVMELPAMPPPTFEPIFLLVTYYVGPGRGTKHWKIHPKHFSNVQGAQLYADSLAHYHLHRRIVRIG